MNERIRQIRKTIDRISVTLITRFIWTLSKVLPYRPGVWLGGVLGALAYLILHRERTRALTHLKMAFPEQSADWIRRTARRSFIHLGKSALEIMLMSPKRMARITAEVRGEDNLRKAIAMNKGVVYVSGHIGNWELFGGMVAQRFPGTPVIGIAAPIEPESMNDMIVMLRARMGSKTLLRGKPGAARELIRAFKENRILGIFIDQDTDVEGAFVDFMGRPAWTPTGAASMAIKFGAPLIFGYLQRGKDNRHTATMEGPLELINTGDLEKDIVANTALLTKKIEDCVRNNPEQWVWMHRRWRTRP